MSDYPDWLSAGARAEWEEWLASRPEAVRAVAEAYPPFVTFRYEGEEAAVLSYPEHSCGHVAVRIIYGRDPARVAVVKPEDLERAPEASP